MSTGRTFRAVRAGSLILGLAVLSHMPLAAQGIQLRQEVPPLEPRECPAGMPGPPVPSADAEEAARLATAATHAAILGDHGEARDLLARAAALDPAAENVAFLFARTLDELGELELALREYCRFVSLAGDTPDARDIREYVRRVAPPERPGIPDSAVARFEAALEAYGSARLAEAEEALSTVVSAAPLWSSPYYNRGVVRAALNRRDASLADFERFLELEPGAPEREPVIRWTAELRAATGVRYSPATAFVAGLLPGAGHFYTRRPVMGTFLLAVAGGAVAAGIGYEVTHVECLGIPQDGDCPPDQILAQHDERPLLVPGIAVAAAASLLGAIDAALGARRRNAQPPVVRLSGEQAGVRLLPPAARRHGASLDLAWFRLVF